MINATDMGIAFAPQTCGQQQTISTLSYHALRRLRSQALNLLCVPSGPRRDHGPKHHEAKSLGTVEGLEPDALGQAHDPAERIHLLLVRERIDAGKDAGGGWTAHCFCTDE